MDHDLIIDAHISNLKITFSAIYQSLYIAHRFQHAKLCICICIFMPLSQNEEFRGLRSDFPCLKANVFAN